MDGLIDQIGIDQGAIGGQAHNHLAPIYFRGLIETVQNIELAAAKTRVFTRRAKIG